MVRRAARGDEPAFVEIWNRCRDSVYRSPAWMLGERAAAEDVTQEAFLAPLRHPGRFNSEAGSLERYLLAIARNLCRKRLRSSGPDAAGAVDVAIADSPLDRLAAAQAGHVLRAAVAALPAGQREAVFLFEVEELSLAEMAGITGVDVNAVKQRLHRARQRLRRELSWMKT